MIIARLHIVESPNGERYLTGRTVGSWPVPPGTWVVLRRDGPDYLLIELAERKCGRPDEAKLLSFIPDDLV